MGEKVKIDSRNVQISREPGLLYFVARDGNIYSTKMQHRGRAKGKPQKHTLVMRTGLVRDDRYVYYIDSEGYLSKARRRGK